MVVFFSIDPLDGWIDVLVPVCSGFRAGVAKYLLVSGMNLGKGIQRPRPLNCPFKSQNNWNEIYALH